ncbi:MAG: hypothetical protein HZC37_03680 [Burkholderiales bacterium]|nr:hypothetical protein [Burkholderiales bacterium]
MRFDSLFDAGRAFAFPCDGAGRVDLDALSERARCNYFFARAGVGRHFAHPAVVALPRAPASTLH